MMPKRFWIILLTLVFSLSLWAANAAAYYAPLQKVTAWVDGVTVRFKVFDPRQGRVVEDSWTVPEGTNRSISQLSVQQGVVSWGYYYGFYATGVGSAVYDPARGVWKTGVDEFDNGPTVKNQDGVVVGVQFSPPSNCITYRTYDPAAGSWKTGLYNFPSSGVSGNSMAKDGVVAWSFVQSGIHYSVGYTIYDPFRAQWVGFQISLTSPRKIQNLRISNATVYYDLWDGNAWTEVTAGYDTGLGAWYEGPTKTSAFYAAQPTAGVRPLWLWFTDMSIAGTTWNWHFGDTSTSISRSPYHTYTQAGVFQPVQSVLGAQGGQTAVNCVRVFDGTTLLGVSWYSNPSSPLIAINPATGAGSAIGPTGFNSLNSLASDKLGNLYSASGNQLIRIDPVFGGGTAAATLNFGATPVDVRGLAFSPDGVLFAVVNNTSNADLLYIVNVATGVGTLVGDTGLSGVQSITFDSRGALYGWDINVGLVTINPGTGAATDVNPAQGGTTNIQGIAFGPDRILYGAGNALYKINTATGAWTPVGAGGYADVRGLEAALVTPIARTSLPAIILNLLSD